MEDRSGGPGVLSSRLVGRRLELVGADRWTVEQAALIDRQIDGVLARADSASSLVVDMGGVSELDTYGATLLARLQGEARLRSLRFQITGLAERFAGLVAMVAEAAAMPHPPEPRAPGWRDIAARLNALSSSLGRELADLLEWLGAVVTATAGSLARPMSFRLTSLVHQLDRVAWQAIPIIVLITFLIGAIIAQQGFFHFRKFGADQYVVDMVGILVLREIGVLIVAIMVAGRSGSSYTAELGSMKMREEIDALRTMGLDPVAVLMLPRVLALILALPALAFIGSLSALLGGGLVAWLYGDMHPAIFIARLKEAISITHFKVGLIKAPIMALAIGIVACSEGMKVAGSAESLGLRTTASVVKSIFLVIVMDGVFAIYFAAIGM